MSAEPKADDRKLVSLDDMIRAGGESTIVFGQLFLPKTFRLPSPRFHYEIGDALDGPGRYIALKVHRDGAKTSLLRTYAMKRICYALSNFILITSAKAGHAAISVMWIRNRIEDSPLIREAFGLAKGTKWTEDHIEIIRTRFPEGHPLRTVTIMAVGLTGQVRGFNVDDYRPDLILFDDGQTDESVGTVEQSMKTSDLTFGALMGSLVKHSENPQAKFVILQTPMEHGDVIDIVSKSPLWKCLSFSIYAPNGESAWPERISKAEIDALKAEYTRIGKYAIWMKEYEVRVVKGERQAFDMTQVRIIQELPPFIHDKMTAIDPASSDSKRADNQAVVTTYRADTDFIVVDCHAAKGEMPDEIANVFFQQWKDWHPRLLRVEKTGYQRVLAWYITQEMNKRRIWVTIDKVDDRRKKSDRIIQSLAGLVSHGRLCFYAPTGLMSAELQALYDEMAGYEPMSETKHDDRVDALSMTIDGLNNLAIGDMTGSIEQMARRERREFATEAMDENERERERELETIFGGAP